MTTPRPEHGPDTAATLLACARATLAEPADHSDEALRGAIAVIEVLSDDDDEIRDARALKTHL